MTVVAASQGTAHEATVPPAARQDIHAGTLPASSSDWTDCTRVGEAAAQPASTRLLAIVAGVGEAGDGLQSEKYTTDASRAHAIDVPMTISRARLTMSDRAP